MLWFFVLILAGTYSTSALEVAETPKENITTFCKKNFRTSSTERLTENSLLGMWYEVANKLQVVCVNFEVLTDQNREEFTHVLKINSSALDQYSLLLTRNCPERALSDTEEEVHVWRNVPGDPDIEKKYLMYSAATIKTVRGNATIEWNSYAVLLGKFAFGDDDDFLGVAEMTSNKFVCILTREKVEEYDENYLSFLYDCFTSFFEDQTIMHFKTNVQQ